MKLRPEDQNGDVLPVLHVSDMFSGALAVAKLVEDRLNLYSEDWWENPAWGNEILRMLQDEKWALDGGRFSWGCTVLTEYGKEEVEYEG